MLTREEANILINKLTNVWAIQSSRNAYLIDCVNEFIEKPRREIQVGDIYRDSNNNFIEIIEIKRNLHTVDYPVVGRCLGLNRNREYSLDGIYDTYYGELDYDNLDLSKRYKFVEIKDVD